MGCNIHVHAEVLFEETWHHYGHYEPGLRWYELFHKIGGVRYSPAWSDKPLTANRGIPEDASALTRFCVQEGLDEGGHSTTWLSSREVEALDAWIGRPNALEEFLADCWDSDGEGFSGTCRLFDGPWKRSSCAIAGLEDFRWVVWFDN